MGCEEIASALEILEVAIPHMAPSFDQEMRDDLKRRLWTLHNDAFNGKRLPKKHALTETGVEK